MTALYDYEAQAEGDLSFTTGDVIEIVTRTNNENEWWIGKLNGKQGQFPGMSLYRLATVVHVEGITDLIYRKLCPTGLRGGLE